MSLNNNKTRCLYCSLFCPVSVNQRVSGVIEPAYVDRAEEGGLCYRGHYISALMGHPRRLTGGLRRLSSGTGGVGSYATLLAEAAEAIRNSSGSDSLYPVGADRELWEKSRAGSGVESVVC